MEFPVIEDILMIIVFILFWYAFLILYIAYQISNNFLFFSYSIFVLGNLWWMLRKRSVQDTEERIVVYNVETNDAIINIVSEEDLPPPNNKSLPTHKEAMQLLGNKLYLPD